MNEKTYCVYCHTNKINGKKYIGQTCQKPEVRWGNNGNGYKPKGKNVRSYLWNSICKYGWNEFEHEILKDGLSFEEANYWEKYYINLFRTFTGYKDSNGYNQTLGGDGTAGAKHTEEWKKCASERMTGELNHNYGKKASEETRRKLSESHRGTTGKHHSEETKQKMSLYQKNRTEKHRKHISDSKKGVPNYKKRIPIIAINLLTFEEKEFDSAVSASKVLKIDRRAITAVVNKERKYVNIYTFRKKDAAQLSEKDLILIRKKAINRQPVIVININTGETKEYKTRAELSKALNIDISYLCKCIKTNKIVNHYLIKNKYDMEINNNVN